ncbi:LacI family DNA-binding transcriptional regulator [Streptomyces sp. NPDC059083]|uniref:LacI family DNA-binding transcriptional regulator n=1 Tax=Streptomyces sp. NPDC059083 TaxID=3346721 RepID=UPI00367E08D0
MTAEAPITRPSSADVARRAGVSRATVSYILNGRTDVRISEQTRDRVLAAVHDLGYVPNATARTLRAGRGNTVLIPMLELPASPASDAFTAHFARELAERDLCLLVHGGRERAGLEAARAWAELRPAAVIAHAQQCPPESVDFLRRAGVEVVALLGAHPDPATAAIPIPMDPNAVARAAADHLIRRGCRRLACLVPGDPLTILSVPRFETVKKVAAASGLLVERVDCDLTEQSLTPTITRWRAEPETRPDGVYAYNDEHALLLIEVLREAGLRVPSDIAVVGSGNFPMGRILRPHLTTTYGPAEHMAALAAAAIRAALDADDTPPPAEPPHPELIVRESA